MPSVKFALLPALAVAAAACASIDRPRTLFRLGVIYTSDCGAPCRDAEDLIKGSELEVVASVVKARNLQGMGINRINWDPSKRSRLLCNKKEKRCMYSLRPVDVQKAESIGDFFEDLPFAYVKDVITAAP